MAWIFIIYLFFFIIDIKRNTCFHKSDLSRQRGFNNLLWFVGGSRGSTPEQDREGRLGTSPHINKFLAREPPDGCEKVNLKFVEDARYVTWISRYSYTTSHDVNNNLFPLPLPSLQAAHDRFEQVRLLPKAVRSSIPVETQLGISVPAIATAGQSDDDRQCITLRAYNTDYTSSKSIVPLFILQCYTCKLY